MESLILGRGFDAVDFFLNVFFSSTDILFILAEVLYIVGLWRLFMKSGIPGWWALIPCAKEYQLSRCAGREPEGKVLVTFSFLFKITVVFGSGLFLPLVKYAGAETTETISVIVSMAIAIGVLVYQVRVIVGLLEVYGKGWKWLLPWVILEGVTACIWGFHSDFQPAWKVEDIKATMEQLATHGNATVMEEGLTVNLEKRTATDFFQKKTLLRDIHMAIPQGHMVLLLGGSGAGKTTFLNAINGYEKADAEILLNKTNLYTEYKKMQYEVGFVPQSEMMRGKDTVLDTLMDAAMLRLPEGLSTAQLRQRVEEVMEIFGLTPVQKSLVEKLSGGQKKRLSISMEFLSNPSLFILDEPDSGLDGVMARELFTQLRKIADTGKIVIVITHTPDRVIDLFDDVIVLAKDSARTGRLAFYGSIEEAKTFFGRDTMEEIVKSVNRPEEGGDGLADTFVLKYAEVHNG